MRLISRLVDALLRLLWRLTIAWELALWRAFAGFVRARWHRFCRFMGRRIVVNTIATTIACIIAGGAVLFFQARVPGLLALQAQFLVYALMMISGMMLAYVVWLPTGGDARFSELIRDRLQEKAHPDARHLERISLKPNKTYAGFRDQFCAIPGNADEILLLLPQIAPGTALEDRFSAQTILFQAAALESHPMKDRVRWVCFATHSGGFVAFQSFAEFSRQVVNKSNARYADLLNIEGEEEFIKAVQGENRYGGRFLVGDDASKRAAIVQDHIGELVLLAIENGRLQIAALRAMLEAGKAQAMLVSPDRKPLGVMTMQHLARSVMSEPFRLLETR